MKKYLSVIPLVILLCFVVGCKDKAAMAELEEFKAQATLEEQNMEIVRHGAESWGKGDFEALKELVAPGYVYYVPSATAKPMSIEESIETGKMIHNAFPDSLYRVEEIFASGDRVAMRWSFKGTHEGEFMGIPPTGNKFELSGIVISRIENGKIVEEREDYDTLGVLQQLSMELKPAEEKK